MSASRNLIFLFLPLFISLKVVSAPGNEDPVVMVRLVGEIRFDGMPDEEAWKSCEPFPMVTHTPVFGKGPAEKTDIRILYDEDYIYIGASLYAKDPSLIQAGSKKRDELRADCDWIGITFDSFNDNENGLSFWTTPTGLRTDMAVFNDAAGTDPPPISESWNTHWDVKSTRNEEGWFTEILIPVSSLRFQEVDGRVIMGLILVRWVPYTNEMYIYPPIPNEYGAWSAWKVSLARDVEFPGLKSRKPLYIAPYGVAGINQANELNGDGTAYQYSRKSKLDAGIDLKYGINSNLTLDVTVNTDLTACPPRWYSAGLTFTAGLNCRCATRNSTLTSAGLNP